MKVDKSDLQLESVVSRINANEIDLQPDFQRGEIWDSKRRQRLVDTILRGWYVPAVHIVVDRDGGEVVLDGQQRLATIRDFIDNKIRVDGRIDPPNEVIQSFHGLYFSELPETVQRSVNRFVLQVITLTDYLPQEPNELFFRLNQSYNLTPPEKRNALHGEARDQVKDLVEALVLDGLLDQKKIGFSNGRLAYDDIVSRVCVALELGNLRIHINNNVVEDFYRSQAFSEQTMAGVHRSGQLLLGQIDSGIERVKFNKGTLQTWLVYCYWAPHGTDSIPQELLHSFENDRARLRSGGTPDARREPHLAEVIRIYDDRASYRVTDVSSVLARDLAVHLYSQALFGTRGVDGSSELLDDLARVRSGEVQGRFFEFIESSHWGESIVDD